MERGPERQVKREIAFLVFPNFDLQDLSGPITTFEAANKVALNEPYRLSVVSPQGGHVRCSAGVEVRTDPLHGQLIDTLIFIGQGTSLPSIAERNLRALAITFASHARRFGAIGAGTVKSERTLGDFTTPNGRALKTARVLPWPSNDYEVQPDAGTLGQHAPAIDARRELALAIIEEDLGFEASRSVARQMEALHRPGYRHSYSGGLNEPETNRVKRVLDFARRHLGEKLSVERLAEVACLSPRQFCRVFTAELGLSPARAIERLRTEAARVAVETSTTPIETIAFEIGFADPERMRRSFIRLFGRPPHEIRRMAAARSCRPPGADDGPNVAIASG